MSTRKSIISPRKIPVEGSNDGILPVRIIDMPRPLTDAGTAGVCKYNPAGVLEILDESITLDSESDLLGTGRDRKLRFRLYALTGSCSA